MKIRTDIKLPSRHFAQIQGAHDLCAELNNCDKCGSKKKCLKRYNWLIGLFQPGKVVFQNKVGKGFDNIHILHGRIVRVE